MKVLYERHSEQVGELIINRPEKKNAVDFQVIEQFQQYLQALKEDRKMTVLLIRGEGDTFCAGGDLQSFHALKTKEEALTMLKPMGEVLKTIVSLPFITASLLNGTAVGGGAELASATDFRLAKKNGEIGFIQGKLHITTGWGGASLLKKRIGMNRALALLTTARRISMSDAMKLGFVQQIVNHDEEIDRWSQSFLSRNVVSRYKQLLFSEEEKEVLFLAMDKEIEACASLWELEEHHAAVQSFFEKNNKFS